MEQIVFFVIYDRSKYGLLIVNTDSNVLKEFLYAIFKVAPNNWGG